MKQLPKFLTLRGAASYSGLSIDTLKRAIHSQVNTLPAKKTAPKGGRYLVRISDLDTWLEGLEDVM